MLRVSLRNSISAFDILLKYQLFALMQGTWFGTLLSHSLIHFTVSIQNVCVCGVRWILTCFTAQADWCIIGFFHHRHHSWSIYHGMKYLLILMQYALERALPMAGVSTSKPGETQHPILCCHADLWLFPLCVGQELYLFGDGRPECHLLGLMYWMFSAECKAAL